MSCLPSSLAIIPIRNHPSEVGHLQICLFSPPKAFFPPPTDFHKGFFFSSDMSCLPKSRSRYWWLARKQNTKMTSWQIISHWKDSSSLLVFVDMVTIMSSQRPAIASLQVKTIILLLHFMLASAIDIWVTLYFGTAKHIKKWIQESGTILRNG